MPSDWCFFSRHLSSSNLHSYLCYYVAASSMLIEGRPNSNAIIAGLPQHELSKPNPTPDDGSCFYFCTAVDIGPRSPNLSSTLGRKVVTQLKSNIEI